MEPALRSAYAAVARWLDDDPIRDAHECGMVARWLSSSKIVRKSIISNIRHNYPNSVFLVSENANFDDGPEDPAFDENGLSGDAVTDYIACENGDEARIVHFRENPEGDWAEYYHEYRKLSYGVFREFEKWNVWPPGCAMNPADWLLTRPPGKRVPNGPKRCPICHHKIGKFLIMTKCRHPFCESCIRGWLQRDTRCPVCRA